MISTLKHFSLNCNETNRVWLDADPGCWPRSADEPVLTAEATLKEVLFGR